MKISHGHAAGQATTQVSETFTGTVLRDPVLSGDGAPAVNSVTFPPGARTNWHTHQDGQILIVTSGRGQAATRDGRREVLRARRRRLVRSRRASLARRRPRHRDDPHRDLARGHRLG